MAFQKNFANKTALFSATAFVAVASLTLASSAHAAQPTVGLGTAAS
jgi:hypothetical protein